MQKVNASIITIGDELLIGQTVDTNSSFIGQELNKIGIWVKRKLTVGDNWDEIWNALDEESRNSQVIIITGGLGPTADDITKPLLCKYFGGKLVENEQVLKHIEYLFEQVFRRPGPLLERNRKQAEVPDTCTVLMNEKGTAPGMLFRRQRTSPNPSKGGAWDSQSGTVDYGYITTESPPLEGQWEVYYFSLPGVPYEMKDLILKQVIPFLQKNLQLPVIVHQTLLTVGVGESVLAEKIKDWEEDLPKHIKLAYLPHFGTVRLRLTSTGNDKNKLEEEIENKFKELKQLVNDWLVIDEDMTLPQAIARLLKQRKETVGTAESCTGGYIAHLLSRDPGSSSNYKGSIISYDNDVKVDVLGVSGKTLDEFGAVSKETVEQMAKGAMKQLKTDYVVVTSGILGPDGGSEKKPVGLVWIAVADKKEVIAKEFHFKFDRSRNIEQTTITALNMLRKLILES